LSIGVIKWREVFGGGGCKKLFYQLGSSYLSGFGQLEFDLLEGKWRAFRFEDGDFVVFRQLGRHFERDFSNVGEAEKKCCRLLLNGRYGSLETLMM
jgi:hypothetical protein